jgi:hypothetical protein
MAGRIVTASVLLVGLLVMWTATSTTQDQGQTSAKPRDPPTSGPRSLRYSHAGVTGHVYGQGDSEYWIFEPAHQTPKSTPVIFRRIAQMPWEKWSDGMPVKELLVTQSP